jgi:hypothetical protein
VEADLAPSTLSTLCTLLRAGIGWHVTHKPVRAVKQEHNQLRKAFFFETGRMRQVMCGQFFAKNALQNAQKTVIKPVSFRPDGRVGRPGKQDFKVFQNWSKNVSQDGHD